MGADLFSIRLGEMTESELRFALVRYRRSHHQSRRQAAPLTTRNVIVGALAAAVALALITLPLAFLPRGTPMVFAVGWAWLVIGLGWAGRHRPLALASRWGSEAATLRATTATHAATIQALTKELERRQ